MPPNKRSSEIVDAFFNYSQSANKSLIDSFTLNELKIAAIQLNDDTEKPYYKLLTTQINELEHAHYSKPEIVVKKITVPKIDAGIKKIHRRIDEVNKLATDNVNHDNARVKTAETNIRETIRDVFGHQSPEFDDYKYHKILDDSDYIYNKEAQYQEMFLKRINDTKVMLNGLISRLEERREDLNMHEVSLEQLNFAKVFISHSSKDENVVEKIIDMLEIIGLKSSQIFCTSIEGYGVALGENFLERIKSELNERIIVLFILSKNFYNSPVCLCEMGATWIKTNEHIPILIPPFDFKDIAGVIPHSLGLKVNDKFKWNSLKDQLEESFNINKILSNSVWERKRNNIIESINNFIDLNEKEEKSKHNSKIVSRNRKSNIDWDKY